MIKKISFHNHRTQPRINIVLVFICLILISCEKKEEEIPPSPIPYISYKSISQGCAINMIGILSDSLIVSINYQDGDSDLGINPEEVAKPPYQRFNSDGTENKYYYNYWIDIFWKKNGQYEKLIFIPTLNGQFPRIPNKGGIYAGGNGNAFEVSTTSAYQGELGYTIQFPRKYNQFYGDTIKCSITIADRTSQESNTIETPEFVFGQ